MPELFAPVQLVSYMQRDLQAGGIEVAGQVASAWLRSATGLTSWPAPLPADLNAWAVELAAIAYNTQTPVGGPQLRGVDDTGRRAEILRAAGRVYGPSGAGGPLYSFPAAVSWPDEATPAGVVSSTTG